ncbi:L,D-transpeptidase family protein [Geopsychrobacter electrodiphilus]|uniref:L,D-transpeptidase family protein n=1 Tax=Geopsychrobacter electrodiphilus TaxID=225196 RepID=UPI00146CFAC0|nr:L,D-transpeptidase family protein [Geopsychrobacter electrodiphilus]
MIVTRETTVVGHDRDYITDSSDTLIELARRAGIGFENLVRANPGVDPWNPRAGTRLVLPSAVLLPSGAQIGIIINLAELRLYFFWDEAGVKKVRIYPVGIGREGWASPLGNFEVKTIIDNPEWSPPASLRQEKPELPGIVPPGPDNPLGSYWIGLSAAGVGIHGTNQPLGVGRRVSHGCIRLYPEDIADLVGRVRPGTPVRIVDQPVKQIVHAGILYLEVHLSTENPAGFDFYSGNWNREVIAQTLKLAQGLPVKILPLR